MKGKPGPAVIGHQLLQTVEGIRAARQLEPRDGINVKPVGGMNIYFPMPFHEQARITIQNMAPRPLQDDISSVTYWYQSLPGAPFPAVPDRDALEVV